ncbi:cell division protein FtsQ/DivIB [Colwellia psychrerythraea]|uniref:Cell division protein FtsQ n=1 Tax=Colwellia psychrerythraea TaxID=28229 RepID=A0A099KZJ1_COLPS|nr:cell division protein FtsQ/DivIB [Colwellia psychrerythraea]KGJ95282.1 Cell division protein FtsQ [Colwellia psychrerythraea]
MNKKQQSDNKATPLGQDSALSFGLGLVFFIIVLFSLITISFWLTQHFIGQESAPVTSIDVSGEMPYSKRSDIINAIDQVDMGNFFQVDVNEVQSYVLNLPWVYSVAVRKQWPNRLKIYVVDQNPVALWNGGFLINQTGQVFQADINRINHYLPSFFGPEGSELLALENYRDLNALLDFKALKIDELVLSERFSWQLTLDDGVTLNLGREERVERIQRFMDVYPIIKAQLKTKKITEKEQNQAVDYIDLRYDTGLAVGWKTVDNISQNKTQRKLQKNNKNYHLKSAQLVKSLS